MRIAFLGKGGSGKTTISAGFVKYLSRHASHVLAVDADVNAHFQEALGINGTPVLLGDKFEEITRYLAGTRDTSIPFIMSTPPTKDSRFVQAKKEDPFISKYALSNGTISLLTVGSYQEEDIASACYHEKLGGLMTFFHHLLDTDSEYVVTDATAGIDTVGTALLFAYDLICLVVEPTEKSLKVYTDFKQATKNLSIPLLVIGNKITNQKGKDFIKRVIGENELVGFVSYSKDIREFEKGEESAFDKFVDENSLLFDTLASLLSQQKRDWDTYYKNASNCHRKLCEEWYNQFYGVEVTSSLDPQFSYREVLKKYE